MIPTDPSSHLSASQPASPVVIPTPIPSRPTSPPNAHSSPQVLANLGSLQSLVRDEIQRDSLAPPRCALSVAIQDPGFPHIDTVIHTLARLDIPVELLVAHHLPQSSRAVQQHLSVQIKHLPIDYRFRLVAPWHLANLALGDVVLVVDPRTSWSNLAPADILRTIAPIQLGLAKAVHASRFLASPPRWNIANLSKSLANLLSHQTLTDITPPLKAFQRSTFLQLQLSERSNRIDAEAIAQLTALDVSIAEVTIADSAITGPSTHVRFPRALSHLAGSLKHAWQCRRP